MFIYFIIIIIELFICLISSHKMIDLIEYIFLHVKIMIQSNYIINFGDLDTNKFIPMNTN